MVSVSDQFELSLAEAETWTFRSTSFPEEPGSPYPVRECFRIGDVSDVFVERADLHDSAVSIYQRTKRGSVVKLIAGTGTGKSTKVPVSISVSVSCIGLVLFPTAVLAQTVSEYVKKDVAVGAYAKCCVTYVDCLSTLLDIQSPGVAYVGANEFLAILAANPKLFSDITIAYMILDESHERIPAYMVIRYMLSTDVFKKTRVFFASATSSGQNMEKRTEGVKLKLESHDPMDMTYEDPDSFPSKSPMFHANVLRRVIVFLPHMSCFSVLSRYYKKYAVCVRALYPTATVSEIRVLNDFLREASYPVVVLATPFHQTGYTFNVDVSVSCGATSYITVEPEDLTISRLDRIETEFEKVQRLGRAGRHMNGAGHFVKAEPSNDDFELYSGSEIYVPLWFKLFNMSASIPYLDTWFKMVEHLSDRVVRILLCARVHPALLVYYLASDGNCFNGTRSVFPRIVGRLTKIGSSGIMLPSEVTEEWRLVKYQGALALKLPHTFRVPGDIPVDWHPIAYVLYHGLSGFSITTLLKDGKVARSVIDGSVKASSVVSYGMTASVVSRLPAVVGDDTPELVRRSFVDRSDELSPSDSASVVARPSFERGFSRVESVPTYHTNVPSPLGGRKISSRDVGTSERSVVAGRDDVGAVGQKRTSKHKRRVSPALSPVDSAMDFESLSVATEVESVYSVDQDAPLKLKCVHAAKLVSQRIRPRISALMARFRTLRVDKRQEDLYRGLKECNVEIALLSKPDMEKYFLATVLMWNRRISNHMQFTAAPSRVPLFANVINNKTFAKYKESLDVCRGFLVAFEHHGYKLALYEGIDHLGVVVETDALRSFEISAESTMTLVSDEVTTAVAVAQRCVHLYRHGHGRVGHYFIDGSVMYIVDHVFEVMDDCGTMFVLPRADVKYLARTHDGRLTRCALHSPAESVVQYRPARSEEFVLVLAFVGSLQPKLYGPFVVQVVDDGAFHSGVLTFGMSGAPLVSIHDGCVVGFHVGHSGFVGSLCSEFASI